MRDIQSGRELKSNSTAQTCKLCIVGAGFTGLNALFVATEYLSKTDRVILIDRLPQCGGMWNSAYDYIRLHQPHRMFTAGNIPWRWNKPAGYLATGTEVQDHFTHCLNILRDKVDLVELFDHEVELTEEIETDTGPLARIKCRSLETNAPVSITADRLINATALNVPGTDPLRFKGVGVTSTMPSLLEKDGHLDSTNPLYVVGGGKTGMDTIFTCLQRSPDRKITLINGEGTVFANRDQFLPSGVKRWWRGQVLLETFRDLALRFDGTNEDDVFTYFRQRYAISHDGTGEQFLFGLLSEKESATVAAGLSETIKTYLEDVEDTASGPRMILRDGTSRAVEPGSVFVNCTGHLLRRDLPDSELLSPQDTTLNITTRAAVHFLPSVASYFLTHLFMRGTLRNTPLYVSDMASLFKLNRKGWQATAITQSYLNAIILLNSLPFSVVNKCGQDIDKWYPWPRRLACFLDIRLNQRHYLAHCRETLDKVQKRYGVRCHPVSQ